MYCGCIKKYNVGDTDIDYRTRFFKSIKDVAEELVFASCSSDDDRYDVITLKKNANLDKKVYIYKVECIDPVAGTHAQYECKNYTLKKVEFSGTIKEVISKYKVKTK